LKVSPVEIRSIITEVIHDLEEKIREKCAKVEFLGEGEVMGDRNRLKQLFQNLVCNSLKYNKEGERPHVVIQARMIHWSDWPFDLQEYVCEQYCLIEITDHGIGFDQGDEERIFKVFQRLHGNAEYSGNGVGLSIAQKIAAHHHGDIKAKGEPGVGATFWVVLPERGGSW
jgi:signal transduction histidine kinase